MRNRVSGGVGDLMLSPKSKDAASKAAPPSPSDDHHNLPKDLKMGWHSTVGGAPTGRGSTPLKRILSNVGAILIILATPPFATLMCVIPSPCETTSPGWLASLKQQACTLAVFGPTLVGTGLSGTR